MRYISVFCGRYSLATGTRFIAWFYIVLYLINVVLNILAVNIVESYKENVDENIHYDRDHLFTFHYICLAFGVVTILLSIAFLVKWSESEDFMQFMVKWNVVRCFFAFAAIIYVGIAMDHILPVSLSLLIPSIDLCATSYFTGVIASYIKELDDPNGQIQTRQQSSGEQQCVHLVSHKTSLHSEYTVSYVNEAACQSSRTVTDEFVDIPLNEGKKRKEEGDVPATVEEANEMKKIPDTQPQKIEGEKSESKESKNKTSSHCSVEENVSEATTGNDVSLDTLTNSIVTNVNANDSKNESGESVPDETIAVDVNEAPTVVVTPASPDVEENRGIKEVEEDDSPAFKAVKAEKTDGVES